MKVFLLFLLISAVATCGHGWYFFDSITPKTIIQQFERMPLSREIFKSKSCAPKEKQIKDSLETLVNTILTVRAQETTCGIIKTHFVNGTQEAVEILESCLESKYHDLPKFVVKMFSSLMHYVCTTKGERIFELFNPCLSTISLSKGPTCLAKLKEKADEVLKDASTVNVKTELCESVGNVKECFLEGFEQECGNKITRESAVGLYDALITKPCEL